MLQMFNETEESYRHSVGIGTHQFILLFVFDRDYLSAPLHEIGEFTYGIVIEKLSGCILCSSLNRQLH